MTVEGVAGTVEVEAAFRPTFDYARARTILAYRPEGAIARAGRGRVEFTCPITPQPDVKAERDVPANKEVSGHLRIAPG